VYSPQFLIAGTGQPIIEQDSACQEQITKNDDMEEKHIGRGLFPGAHLPRPARQISPTNLIP